MRVISGTSKGTKLIAPQDRRIRPTSSRVREAIFSILGDVEGAVVVDGFAGSGALGCEALSRGAERVYFFDRSDQAIRLVEENVHRVDAVDRAEIWQVDYARGLERLEEEPGLFFLDPPYGTDDAEAAIRAMEASASVTEGALVVLEQGEDDPEIESELMERLDVREYSGTRVSFYRR